ncbi:hypothetical protein EYF80_002893 [Liparis tanakae]|uniref:Uncharacterized protein n=1 Tax=Liparis tanakae TaxID=230148 RepID=A0A4Z2J9C9_9TELE|nr:hypothetical protein EYF80_002893 [Liparis tanakae]
MNDALNADLGSGVSGSNGPGCSEGGGTSTDKETEKDPALWLSSAVTAPSLQAGLSDTNTNKLTFIKTYSQHALTNSSTALRAKARDRRQVKRFRGIMGNGKDSLNAEDWSLFKN